MKVLIFANALPPRAGGIERHTHGLATYLASIPEIEVAIACAKSLPSSDEKRNYKVIEFPSYFIANRLPIPSPIATGQWRQLITEINSADMVILQSHLFPLNWICTFLARKIPKRVWITHSSGYIPDKNFMIQSLIRIWEQFGIYLLNRFTNYHVTTSMNSRQWMESIGITDIRVIPNAINPQDFSIRDQNLFSKTKVQFLFAGRLLEGKGGEEAIKLLNNLSRYTSRLFELTVIGTGPELDRMIEEANKSNFTVHFLGEINHKEVIKVMLHSDILLFTSQIPESMPTIILEAAASGMLVVSVPTEGIEALVKANVILSESIEFLPQIIGSAINAVEQSRVVGKDASSYILDNFTWEKSSNLLLKL